MAACKSCGKEVIETPNGKVHAGGGKEIQRCQNGACGWSGSQYGGFTSCPSCGDAMSLTTDHAAN